MEYHAHIYWDNNADRSRVLNLRSVLLTPQLKCKTGILHDDLVGPHPKSQMQVRYTDEVKDVVEAFIKNNTKGMSVLYHESTKDDVRDHTEGARWTGDPLTLNLKWLEENSSRDDRRKL